MKAIIVILFIPILAFAGTGDLTGNARVDLLSVSAVDTVPQPQTLMARNEGDQSKLKSPALGGALSLLVPGAGEYYSERYTKGGIFFAIEVAAVTAAIIYNNKGDNKTNDFQSFADAHWSAVRYAKWINAFSAADYKYGPQAPIDIPRVAGHDFSEIRAWESGPHQSIINSDIQGFSHQLPDFGDQQYYELIGKYNQYKFGWDTYPDANNDGIPDQDGGHYNDLIPQEMKDYAVERGKANDYYYAAEVATALIVANHVISALDGIWSTLNYNKAVTSEVGLRFQDIGGGEKTVASCLTVRVRL